MNPQAPVCARKHTALFMRAACLHRINLGLTACGVPRELVHPLFSTKTKKLCHWHPISSIGNRGNSCELTSSRRLHSRFHSLHFQVSSNGCRVDSLSNLAKRISHSLGKRKSHVTSVQTNRDNISGANSSNNPGQSLPPLKPSATPRSLEVETNV